MTCPKLSVSTNRLVHAETIRARIVAANTLVLSVSQTIEWRDLRKANLMNWRRLCRHLLLALFIGVAVTGICNALLHSRFLHSPTVIALGPGRDFRMRWHPNCHSLLRCNLEALAANVVIYAFWTFVGLVGIDLLLLKRKLAP